MTETASRAANKLAMMKSLTGLLFLLSICLAYSLF